MIRLISAVPICMLIPPLMALLDLLFHLFQLCPDATVVDLALEMDDRAADQAGVGLLVQHDLLARDFPQRLAEPLEIAVVQRTRGDDARLRLPLPLVEHSPVALDDAGKKAQAVALDEQR